MAFQHQEHAGQCSSGSYRHHAQLSRIIILLVLANCLPARNVDRIKASMQNVKMLAYSETLLRSNPNLGSVNEVTKMPPSCSVMAPVVSA